MALEEPVDIVEVVKEPDVFRLAIRGHAAVEDTVDATIALAFGGAIPAELRRLRYGSRLALLAGLTPLPAAYIDALEALAQVRNEFAHSKLNDLSTERAQALAQKFRDAAPDSFSQYLDDARNDARLTPLFLS